MSALPTQIQACIAEILESDQFLQTEQSWYAFILAYGPFIAMHYNDNTKLAAEMVHHDATGIFRLMQQTAKDLSRAMESTMNIGDFKRELILRNRKMLASGVLEATTNLDITNHWIHNIRERQREEKATEGAMMNMAPIVPYEVNLKKQAADPIYTDVDVRVAMKKRDADFFLTLMEKELKSTDLTAFGPQEASNIATKIFRKYCYGIMREADNLTCAGTDKDGILYDISYFVEPDSTQDKNYPYYKAYYFFAQWALCDLHADVVLRQLKQYVDASESLVGHHTFIPAVEQYLSTMTEESLEKDYERYFCNEAWEQLTAQSQAIVDDLVRQAGMHDIEQAEFDLDKLFYFVHEHHQLVTCKESNTAFLTEARGLEIVNYSFFKEDLMLVEIVVGNARWVVVPITDIVDNWNMKLVCMDTSSNIYFKPDLDFGAGANMEKVA